MKISVSAFSKNYIRSKKYVGDQKLIFTLQITKIESLTIQ